MTTAYFSGGENVRRKIFDAFNTINKDIVSNANIIRNWVVELLKTGKRPPLYTVVPSLKALSTNEKTLTLDWFNSCIDDILSGKNNANDNLIDAINDAVSEKQKLFSELVYRVTGKTAQNYEPCTEWKEINSPVDGAALYHPNGRRLMIIGDPNPSENNIEDAASSPENNIDTTPHYNFTSYYKIN